MVRRLIDRWRDPKPPDPWTQLVRNSAAGIRDANELIGGIVDRAGGLGEKILAGEEPVALFNPREAEGKWEEILAGIEDELRRLCSLYDYRHLFFVSRLCSGIPALRKRDPEMEATRVRSQNADRWILRCADRRLDRDYIRLEEHGPSVKALPATIFHDAVKLHVLADLHTLMSITRMMYNLMRLVSSESGIRPGPLLRLRTNSRIGHEVEATEIRKLASVHSFRYKAHNEDFSMWAMVGSGATDEPDALLYGYFPDVTLGSYGGGILLAPNFMSLDTLIEYGMKFRRLFEREDGVGMPPEHFHAISRGLRDIGLISTERDERLDNWAYRTGTLPVPRNVLLGGPLEEAAQAELAEVHPERSADDLSQSVRRFVALASSSGHLGAGLAPVSHPKRERDAAADRTLGYPYMVHGSKEQELWIVDFANTPAFYQSLAGQLRFSPSKKTTGSGRSESYDRTSVFDARIAEMMTSIPGIEPAFEGFEQEDNIEKEDPELPNITFRLPGGDSREIDVPLRHGGVLVAVQTWAREVDLRIDEGAYRQLQRRWDKAKEKLENTDTYYTDYLLCNPAGREHMEHEGLSYILPVLCGPFTEPLVSIEDKFWLRYPDMNSFDSPQESIPRILTPSELEHFLSTTSEEELIEICGQHGWML
ncbi:hypothetical protein BH23ACT11_BH23ACT11_27040 [soil metagenome]